MYNANEWKLIEKAREEYKRAWARQSTVITLLGYVSPTGDLTVHGNTACHASLNYYHSPCLAVISGIMNPRSEKTLPREILHRYFQWLMFDSPFKGSFMNETVEDALDNHLLLNIFDIPRNVMVGGAFASRHPSEFPRRCL